MLDLNSANLIIGSIGAIAALLALLELPKWLRAILAIVGITCIATFVAMTLSPALIRPHQNPPAASPPAAHGDNSIEVVEGSSAEIDAVVKYYNLMPNTAEGWKMIGPHLRLRNRENYEKHWSQISGVEILERPTSYGNHVTVRIALYYRDDRPKRIEIHDLGLIRQGDQILIDSDYLISAR